MLTKFPEYVPECSEMCLVVPGQVHFPSPLQMFLAATRMTDKNLIGI